jgi:hypothetical protein
MEEILKINPLFYALAPLSMALRATHCLPIMLQSTSKKLTFDKQNEHCLPCDVMFQGDSFSTFQFIQYHFVKRRFLQTIHAKLNKWSQTHFQTDANIETVHGSTKDFVMEIVKHKPSLRIGNHAHLFVLFPETNEFIGFVDHYYSDGVILYDLFQCLYQELTEKLPFPKYTYYPLISDAFVCEYIARSVYDICNRPYKTTLYSSTRIFNRRVMKEDVVHWNRWSNYAMNIVPIFECMPDLDFARIAINVGIETDNTFGNNRIGAIIVCIDKPPNHLSHNSKLEHLMDQFQKQVTKYYKDCMTTYDILRSYDTSWLRKLASSKFIDIYMTAMFKPVHMNHFDLGVGAFIGNDYDFPFCYINSTTIGNFNSTTFTTNWTNFNDNKFSSRYKAKRLYKFVSERSGQS